MHLLHFLYIHVRVLTRVLVNVRAGKVRFETVVLEERLLVGLQGQLIAICELSYKVMHCRMICDLEVKRPMGGSYVPLQSQCLSCFQHGLVCERTWHHAYIHNSP